ncbi:MAG: hypothetical protein ACP5GO_05850 [Thermoprotei archaeon]
MSKIKKRYIPVLISLLLVMVFVLPSNAVKVMNGEALSQTSSLKLNAYGSYFIYVAVTGGGVSVGATSFAQDAYAQDFSGYTSVVIGHSGSSLGSFQSGPAAYYAIGGISVQGSPSAIYYKTVSGMSNAVLSFSVSGQSLLAIASAGSSLSKPYLSGPAGLSIPVLATATNPNYGVIVAFANVTAGTYSINVTYATTNDTNPMSEAVALAVYVFPISSSSSSSSSPPQSPPPTSSPPASTYPLTFVESGLPSGSTWYLYLDGISQSSSSSYITVYVKAGTYSYSVPSEQGYSASPSSGSVTVGQGGAQVSLKFVKPLPGFSLEYSPYVLVGVGALIAAGVAFAISLLSKGGDKE